MLFRSSLKQNPKNVQENASDEGSFCEPASTWPGQMDHSYGLHVFFPYCSIQSMSTWNTVPAHPAQCWTPHQDSYGCTALVGQGSVCIYSTSDESVVCLTRHYTEQASPFLAAAVNGCGPNWCSWPESVTWHWYRSNGEVQTQLR